jgi:4-hydroxybutyrate dehydrogenase
MELMAMKLFSVRPQIHKFSDFSGFVAEFKVGKGDLVLTNEIIYENFMKSLNLESDFLFQERYGVGEPSNTMIDKIVKEITGKEYQRIIAVGGGTIIDICKILALKNTGSTLEMFERKCPIIKEKQLIIIPTTCGTGSEVTNLTIAEIVEKQTKLGLGVDVMYADQVVLIPELVKGLPYKFFVFSSVDALIHGVESFVAPKSNSYTELFGVRAIDLILNGYLKIVKDGANSRFDIIEDFLVASNYAGIAFGNTGVGAVHALSYPLGGNYHVPHGEANYQFLIEVFKTYQKLQPEGKIQKLTGILAKALQLEGCGDVFDQLEAILNKLLPKKRLRDYGMKAAEIETFADSVLEKQQRLLVNNYTPFTRETIISIYQKLY